MATMKTKATVQAMRTSVRRTTASSQNNNWNDTHNKQLTMHNKYTNDDVDFDDWRGAHHALSLHIARTVPHLMMTPHTSWLKF